MKYIIQYKIVNNILLTYFNINVTFWENTPMKKIIETEPELPKKLMNSILAELIAVESLLEEKQNYRYFKFNKFRTEIHSEIERSVALYNNELRIVVIMFKSKNFNRKDMRNGWNHAWKRFESRTIYLDQKIQTFKNIYFKNSLIN